MPVAELGLLSLNMKTFCAFLLSIGFAVRVQAQHLPTPEMAIRFALDKDGRQWTPSPPEASETVITQEWVPKGDSIDSWKEMFDHKIILTKVSLREHLDRWKSLLIRVDPKAEIKEEKNSDGSLTVTYTAIAGNEMGISRYFSGSDGIYIFSYRVRPKLKTEERLKIWRDILASASLAPNPLKRKANQTLDRIPRSAVSRVFQCERPWRAPRHRSA